MTTVIGKNGVGKSTLFDDKFSNGAGFDGFDYGFGECEYLLVSKSAHYASRLKLRRRRTRLCLLYDSRKIFFFTIAAFYVFAARETCPSVVSAASSATC